MKRSKGCRAQDIRDRPDPSQFILFIPVHPVKVGICFDDSPIAWRVQNAPRALTHENPAAPVSIALWNVSDTQLDDDAIRPYFRGKFRVGRVGSSARRVATPIDYAPLSADPYFRGLLMDRIEYMRLTLPEYETSIAAARRLIAMLERQIVRLD